MISNRTISLAVLIGGLFVLWLAAFQGPVSALWAASNRLSDANSRSERFLSLNSEQVSLQSRVDAHAEWAKINPPLWLAGGEAAPDLLIREHIFPVLNRAGCGMRGNSKSEMQNAVLAAQLTASGPLEACQKALHALEALPLRITKVEIVAPAEVTQTAQPHITMTVSFETLLTRKEGT